MSRKISKFDEATVRAAWMASADMSGDELAAKLGCSEPHLRNLERIFGLPPRWRLKHQQREDRYREFAQLVEQTGSSGYAQRQLGYGASAMQHLRRQLKIPPRGISYRVVGRANRIYELAERGLNQAKIAAELGLTPSTLCWWLHRHPDVRQRLRAIMAERRS